MYSTKNIHTPGAFEKFWKPFVRVFQVFCVSHYSVYHSNQHVGRLIYHILFFAMHFFTMVYTLKATHHLANPNYKEIPLMSVVSYLSISGDLMEHCVAHLEPLFTRRQEEEMYRLFEEIHTIFATKLNHFVDFDVLRKQQNHTIGFFIFSAVQAFGLSFFTLPECAYGIFLYLLARAIGTIIIRVRRIQSSIVINLLSNVLKDVRMLLEQSQENYGQNSNREKRENIVHLRDIYSKSWLIKNRISCCFGWSFITFIMDYCFDFINSSYWAYIIIKTYKSRMKTIRKFFSLCSVLFFFIICRHSEQIYSWNLTDVCYYLTSINVIFWYLCIISERCQNMVCSLYVTLFTLILQYIMYNSNYADILFMFIGQMCCKSIAYSIKLSR